MNHENTPGTGDILAENGLPYIPEAHCYLRTTEGDLDVTHVHSDLAKLRSDILEEKEIDAIQVAEFKVNYHRLFIQKWITENKLEKSFEDIWEIRERCIQNMSR